jgi:DNA primase
VPGWIRDDDIAQIRDRVRIDEVVREYVSLRNAGGGAQKGLCPFHDEKTPSFHVTPARGRWYCFGCNQGGDVINFLQQIDHLTFTEAVERLADRAGITLRYDETSRGAAPARSREQRTRLIQAHHVAAGFYAEQLATNSEAAPGRRFLEERGFDREAAARFGVGYAPRDGESLIRLLRGRGFSDTEAITSGLVSQGRATPYDRFRGRLVWPIRDLFGDVVGFGARRLFDDDRIEAKYLNTPETPLYKKSNVLYGVDLAKRDIGKLRQAVVVEGYTDVMACHLAGVTTAVATCGTAFGEGHARILRRLMMDENEFRGEVIFTFDGDEAGQKAALRAFEGDQQFVSQTFVAVEPNGLDPCELRQRKGDAAVRELVAGRQRLFEFAIRSILRGYDLDAAEGRVQALDRAVPLVARIRDAALRDEYARRLAGWVGMSEELAIVRRVRGVVSRTGTAGTRMYPAAQAASQGAVDVVDPMTRNVERESLRAAVQHPELAGSTFDELPDEAFVLPVHRTLRGAIAKAGGCASADGGAAWVQAVSDACPDDYHRGLVTRLAVEPLTAPEGQLPRYVSSVVLRAHELWLARQLAVVKSKLQRTDPAEHPDDYQLLFGELMGLERRRRELHDRAFGEVAPGSL